MFEPKIYKIEQIKKYDSKINYANNSRVILAISTASFTLATTSLLINAINNDNPILSVLSVISGGIAGYAINDLQSISNRIKGLKQEREKLSNELESEILETPEKTKGGR